MHQQQTASENAVGKEEIARNEQFLLLLQCLLLYQIIVDSTPFVHVSDIIFLFAAELEEPEIGISGKGLTKLFLKKMYARLHRSDSLTSDFYIFFVFSMIEN